ncbi:hypothetical protein [Pseudidiomarina aestuarii]|uniref:hypothetical protein n=1 Tax=Pseudidiomarina aestuarii TaxID=624146 RepID=UPI003A985FB0
MTVENDNDVVRQAMDVVAMPATIENARQLGKILKSAQGEEKDHITDLVESFLMDVNDPVVREKLLEEIG